MQTERIHASKTSVACANDKGFVIMELRTVFNHEIYYGRTKDKSDKLYFSDEDVLRQLNESELEPEGNDIESFEDYSRFTDHADIL